MKMKIGPRVYLQHYEMERASLRIDSMPSSIFDEAYKKRFLKRNGEGGPFYFDHVFENSQNVAWLMGQDWIVDFNQYKDMSSEEIDNVVKEIEEERERKQQCVILTRFWGLPRMPMMKR